MADSMARMEIDMAHHNALKQRERWCLCCARAVPRGDRSWKFAQAGGIIEGPFCSRACYWRFIRDGWNETTQADRRRVYLYGDGDG